jgi:phospholipid/cholesterol/gamma-HCH transport system substrate-binding protein
MAKESVLAVAKRRGLGVLYLVLITALVWLSVAIYQKKFTPVVLVSLKADHTGNSLQDGSDVKERGIIVGSVRGVKVDSGPDGGCINQQVSCVTVTLALDPSKVAEIPKDVSAQILPKTIFGEQYVSLEIPQDKPKNKQEAIAAGDTISQDRSQGALETEKVLGDLLPLLQAVKPAELNATLTAVATALQGRGEELGNTLVQLDTYLKGLNPHTKNLVDDLGKLGQVSDEYNNVAPDLFATIDNLQTSAKTVIAEKQSVANLFDTATSTSNVIRSFLADNEQRMITVVGTSAKVYHLLAEYSPESTCMFSALAKLYDLASSIIQGRQVRLSIVVDQNNAGGYKPGEQPFYVDGLGPNCFGLPDNPQPQVDGKFQIPPKYQCFNDGAALTDNPCGQRARSNSDQNIAQAAIGSSGENALVSTLISGMYHAPPNKVPPIATMLAAPLLRGTAVRVK